MLKALTNRVFRVSVAEGALVVLRSERITDDGSAPPSGATCFRRMYCGSIVRSVSMKAAAVEGECLTDREGTSAILLQHIVST